ncbi:hypothetical protein ACFQ0I_11965 [Mariniflexile aquimaris]|uniref:Uncharacterized protein n=1 Tax=Mariniflexile aquimaris TaxID=881009 RepID=A0ABW3BVE0_9FLAO
MTLLEKKRKAAVIAATIYLRMEEEEDKNKIVSQYGWGKMGLMRRMNDRKLLFSNGRTIGARLI